MPTTSISITPQFSNNTVTQIICGTSSPKLGGTVDISAFPNLNSFRCVNNDITIFTGNTLCPQLTTLDLGQNKLTSFPSFTNMPLLQELRVDNNTFTGSIPSLNSLTSLVTVRFNHNIGITGNIPSLSLLTNLESFYCIACNLTGPIPSLAANTALKDFRCDTQKESPKLNGSIPSLAANTQLRYFYAHNNNLSGFSGSSVSNTLRDFQAQSNLLTSAAVNAILAAFVAAGRTSADGTCILMLGGTDNAAPTGQGITDKDTLISRGWTVTTN
jgi:Leucine-rich repeat (LRR) protein